MLNKNEPAETIEELKEMPRNDGWGELPTIGEIEGWPGQVENW